MPSALDIATGFSNAMSFAPDSIPSVMNGSRRFGNVQKQNRSGFSSSVSDSAFVLARTPPSFADASLRRFRVVQTLLIDVADSNQLEPRVGGKRGGMVHAALAHADDDDPVGLRLHHRGAALSHSRTLAAT